MKSRAKQGTWEINLELCKYRELCGGGAVLRKHSRGTRTHRAWNGTGVTKPGKEGGPWCAESAVCD